MDALAEASIAQATRRNRFAVFPGDESHGRAVDLFITSNQIELDQVRKILAVDGSCELRRERITRPPTDLPATAKLRRDSPCFRLASLHSL